MTFVLWFFAYIAVGVICLHLFRRNTRETHIMMAVSQKIAELL